MGVSGQCHTPAALPPGMTQYALDRRLGGSQGQPGQVGIISLPLGFDPQTVQPVASHYTTTTCQSTLHYMEVVKLHPQERTPVPIEQRAWAISQYEHSAEEENLLPLQAAQHAAQSLCKLYYPGS
jgi:hypothetical protein